MKLNNYIRILEILYVITVIFFIIAIISLILQEKDCQDRIESYKIYNGIESKSSWGIDGLYFRNEEYYCVNMKNTNIEDTEIHEQCHHLINKDYEHFCNN